MPNYDYNDYNNEDDQENEISRRSAWEIASWVIMALTLLLNLIVILILLARENAYSVVNKGKETIYSRRVCEKYFSWQFVSICQKLAWPKVSKNI